MRIYRKKFTWPAQKMAELKNVAWNVSKLIRPLHFDRLIECCTYDVNSSSITWIKCVRFHHVVPVWEFDMRVYTIWFTGSGAGISIKLQSKDIDTELTVAKNLKKPNSINEDSAIYFTISYKF